MQMISGSISFVHVEDICRAHIFVAENPAASGRYICCAVNTSLVKLAQFLSKRYPQYNVPTEYVLIFLAYFVIGVTAFFCFLN